MHDLSSDWGMCIMSYDICLPWLLTDGHWSISFWLITERELTMQRSRWAGILWRGWSSSVPLHQPTVWWWHWPGHLAGCPVPLPSRTGKTTDVHHPIKQANKPIQSKIVHINIQKLTYLYIICQRIRCRFTKSNQIHKLWIICNVNILPHRSWNNTAH